MVDKKKQSAVVVVATFMSITSVLSPVATVYAADAEATVVQQTQQRSGKTPHRSHCRRNCQGRMDRLYRTLLYRTDGVGQMETPSSVRKTRNTLPESQWMIKRMITAQ